MHRTALVAVAAALSFAPKMCATKSQQPAEAEPAAPPATAVPITSATTPPIWHAPDRAEAPAPASATAAAPPSPELVKARVAAEQKDFKKVRTLLEKKVLRAGVGKSVPEESQLVYQACVHVKDKTCAEAVKARHPGVVTE